MNRLRERFKKVVVWDSEYIAHKDGEHVIPVCAVGRELFSNTTVTAVMEQPGQRVQNPIPFGADTLHILYSATADLGFALAAGWGLPYNVIDLWVERRNLTNNKTDAQGVPIDTSLIYTCHDYGIFDTISPEEKDTNRDRILRGYPYTAEEMQHIVEYCTGDVEMLHKLLLKMLPQLGNLDQSLHRGRCQKAQTCMEWNGVPTDVSTLTKLQNNSLAVRRLVVNDFETEYKTGIHIFDKHGDPHFTNKGFEAWIRSMGFDEKSWPSTQARRWPSADDDEALKPNAVLYEDTKPVIEQYRQLRKFLSLAKSKFKFTVGSDGRNRSSMSPFSARSSRSQPSTSENIANSPKALRSLLAPQQGQVLLHRDWSNAEFGIAAALSGDKKRWDNYIHKDAYLQKAMDYGFCDSTATKETHRELRNKFKPVVLAGQYGQTASGLAKALGIPKKQAEAYQEREAKIYPVYQRWLDANAEDRAFDGFVETVYGWKLWVPRKPTGHDIRTAMNLPMQGNCAEIMRLTACLATERGIDVGASIHDAFMYVAPESSWEEVDAAFKACMDEASQTVLGDGYILKSDRHDIHYPNHFVEEDGEKLWNKIMAALAITEKM